MRRPLSSAVIRRDHRLSRTRKLSAWIAGGATAASVGLASLLGASIPGHAAATGKTAAGAGASGHQGSGQPASSHGRAHAHRNRLSAPSSPPSSAPSSPPTTPPPVVSSGGS